MLSPLQDVDRVLLGHALEHLAAGVDTTRKCHRELEQVQLGIDLHPNLTIAHVYQRLAVVAARLETAHEQLATVVDRAERCEKAGGAL